MTRPPISFPSKINGQGSSAVRSSPCASRPSAHAGSRSERSLHDFGVHLNSAFGAGPVRVSADVAPVVVVAQEQGARRERHEPADLVVESAPSRRRRPGSIRGPARFRTASAPRDGFRRCPGARAVRCRPARSRRRRPRAAAPSCAAARSAAPPAPDRTTCPRTRGARRAPRPRCGRAGTGGRSAGCCSSPRSRGCARRPECPCPRRPAG